MKNKIKYFVLYPLMLLIVILVMTYDVKELISLGVRLPFGEAYWKDSLTNTITTNKSIRLNPGDSLYYGVNTVAVSAGGGDVNSGSNNTLTGNNTFTNGNTFSDSLRANGYSIIDDAKITTNLRVTGDVITDLNFLKGSSTSIGTISTDSLAIITNNTKRIVINKNGYTTITDTAYFSDHVTIIGNLNAASNIYTSGNLTADSIAGIGTYLTSVDAITLKGQDTTHFARTDTLTTENVRGVWNFWNIVRCIGIVTFDVSPVFNSLVNFANGIATTTIIVSSTATFNGDMINNGWKKIGSAHTQYQYTKDTVLKMVLNATSGVAFTDTIRHGIANWRSIVFTQFIVHEDSANINCIIGLYANDAASTSLYGAQAWTDSLFARVRLPGGNGNSTAWRGDTCTVYIKYTDYNR